MTKKIMLIGAERSGKTSFLQMLLQKKELSSYQPTVGLQAGSMTLHIEEKHYVNLQIWDTPGNPSLHTSSQKLYQQMSGFVIFGDLSQQNCIQSIEMWQTKIENQLKDQRKKSQTQPYFSLIFANKLDEKGRQRNDENIRRFKETLSKNQGCMMNGSQQAFKKFIKFSEAIALKDMGHLFELEDKYKILQEGANKERPLCGNKCVIM